MSDEVKSLSVGVPRETYPGERRVALIPSSVATLKKAGVAVLLEAGAGTEAGYADADYSAAGAKIAASSPKLFRHLHSVFAGQLLRIT